MTGPFLTLWLDCSLPLAAGTMTAADRDAAAAELRRVFAGVAAAVVTDMPTAQPGQVCAVRVLAGPGDIPWWPEPAAGLAVPCLERHTTLTHWCAAYARCYGDGVTVGSVAAHELCHLLLPNGRPHDPAGVFSATGDVRGLDLLPGTAAEINGRVYALAAGWRDGLYALPTGFAVGKFQMPAVDPTWELPTIYTGSLIFTAGPCPPLETIPKGWVVQVGDAGADGKLTLDFNGAVVYHPGPDSGHPKKDGFVQFAAAGPTPYPEWGPGPKWYTRPGSGPQTGNKLTIGFAEQLVYLP